VIEPVIKRLVRDRDAEPAHVGEVRQAHSPRRMLLAEDHIAVGTIGRPPPASMPGRDCSVPVCHARRPPTMSPVLIAGRSFLDLNQHPNIGCDIRLMTDAIVRPPICGPRNAVKLICCMIATCFARRKHDQAIVLLSATMLSMRSQATFAHAQSNFILTGDRITNVNSSKERIQLGEHLPVVDLKKRFARYRVRSIFGEGCNFCADVSRGTFGFSVDYDEDGIIIIGITCLSTGCADALGNTIGGSLRQAVGSRASCEGGDFTTCQSRTEFSYIVKDSGTCQLMVSEEKEIRIPSCARIGGFRIWMK
jgi:hypothetical protein